MSDEQTKRLEAAVVALLLLWEGRNALALRLTLLVLFRRITEQLKDRETLPGDSNELFDVLEWRREINETQERYWLGAVVAGLALMSAFVWTAIGKKGKPPRSIDELNPQLKAAFAQWIAERRLLVWQSVTKSAAKRVAKAVEAARLAGLTPAEVAKLIADEAKQWAETGASIVGTTEANAARNFGFNLAMQNVELQGRQWRTMGDNRVRGSRNKKGKSNSRFNHVAANHQLRRMNEPFIVSGEALQFPGDGSLGASIGNLAGCRCWVNVWFGKLP